MKRHPHQQGTFTQTLPCLTLNRDDIERIIAMLEEVAGDNTVVLKDYEGTYDSLDDLKSYRGISPKHILLEIDRPDTFKNFPLSVGIHSRSAVTVQCNDPSLEMTAVARRILDYLAARRRRLLEPLASPVVGLVPMLIFMGFMIYSSYVKAEIPTYYVIAAGVPIMVLFFVFLHYSSIIPNGQRNNISLYRAHETFWQRHEGKLVENFIRALCGIGGGVIGAGILYGIQQMFKH